MRTEQPKRHGRSLQAAAMALLLTVSLTATSAWAQNGKQWPERAKIGLRIKSEIRFMTEMINHHASAVEMAELCEVRAEHDELLAMCTEMKQKQFAEISQLQDWLEEWYNIEHEPRIMPSDQAMIEHLASLNGADFEIAFMEEMIMHHRGALLMVMKHYPKVIHEALRDMMEDILLDQIQEIRQMEEWLCTWYSICSEPATIQNQEAQP